MKQAISIFFILLAAAAAGATDFPKEVLIGYIRDQNSMVFQVFSGGCTQKEDFRLEIESIKDKTFLTLYRQNPDFCKAFMPFGTYISYTYEEIRLSNRRSFTITNPLNPGFIF